MLMKEAPVIKGSKGFGYILPLKFSEWKHFKAPNTLIENRGNIVGTMAYISYNITRSEMG